MYRILSRWLSRFRGQRPQVLRDAFEPEIPDAEILREHFTPSQASISALTDLVRLITTPLGSATRERLALSTRDAAPGEDASAILDWVLTRHVGEPESVDSSEWSLSISVDWRASDEIEWQANRLLDTLGIEDRWRGPDGDRTVPGVLLNFGAWLDQRGYALLHLDTGSDDYIAFVIRRDDVDEALRLSTTAGAVVETGDMFAASSGARTS
ncbi:hypothetical protein [Burkholderia sp. Ac-20365]|uniref:DUF6630 family protein n=1 Tax=Burkholderia sp. Ac-20365 TaxID=2703897 RepID=UPI00197B37C9|nr:hypothetical protein [Burkholderia sp. Ac-20365]MBN3761132.1 hypothetical protein [Burkholderia sp. Ac-20365]